MTIVPTYLVILSDASDDILITGNSTAKIAEEVFDGDVVAYPNYELGSRMVAKHDTAAEFIAPTIQRGREPGRIGIESWSIAKVVLESVSKAVPGAKFVDLSSSIEAMRLIKDADEVANCRKSCEIVDYAYSVADAMAKPGLSEVDLYAAIQTKVVQKAGGFQYFSGDFTAGRRSIDPVPSGAPTALRMKAGDTLILDLWATTNGYWADTCRTFMVGGHPSHEQRQIYQLVEKAMKAGVEQMRPGVVAGDVYRAVKKVFDEAGHGSHFTHHAGHGVGLDAWERPYLIPGSRDTIQTGMVLALEPGLYLKGVAGVRLENNFLIREDGAVPLSTYPIGW